MWNIRANCWSCCAARRGFSPNAALAGMLQRLVSSGNFLISIWAYKILYFLHILKIMLILKLCIMPFLCWNPMQTLIWAQWHLLQEFLPSCPLGLDKAPSLNHFSGHIIILPCITVRHTLVLPPPHSWRPKGSGTLPCPFVYPQRICSTEIENKWLNTCVFSNIHNIFPPENLFSGENKGNTILLNARVAPFLKYGQFSTVCLSPKFNTKYNVGHYSKGLPVFFFYYLRRKQYLKFMIPGH